LVGTRSLSSGAHSRDPLALPTLLRDAPSRTRRLCISQNLSMEVAFAA
jgi:hypothetical protein